MNDESLRAKLGSNAKESIKKYSSETICKAFINSFCSTIAIRLWIIILSIRRKRMKILIIGSMGFIGQHLFRYFSEKDNEVWGADIVYDYINKDRFFLIDASNSDYNSVFNLRIQSLCQLFWCGKCSGVTKKSIT